MSDEDRPVLDLYTLRKWTENYHAENHAHREFADCPLAPCWISLKAGDGPPDRPALDECEPVLAMPSTETRKGRIIWDSDPAPDRPAQARIDAALALCDAADGLANAIGDTSRVYTDDLRAALEAKP